ncbi:hypothetical protein BJ165DRAFT_771534 [Panaeolus papilionaceus]|nr:hypothetical protein BJ165DRAFT_771534 [Panaeolus papilionaceus]
MQALRTILGAFMTSLLIAFTCGMVDSDEGISLFYCKNTLKSTSFSLSQEKKSKKGTKNARIAILKELKSQYGHP